MSLHPARWWTPVNPGKVRCDLCPRLCTLFEGQRGYCGVRLERNGKLWTEVWGSTGGICADPIEKKPLYHFLPGSSVLSFGACGCNLGCNFCQNWRMSRDKHAEALPFQISPEEVLSLAREEHCASVAFTYNEPIISAEFCLAVASACREAGIRTVAVTAGYISPEARNDFFSEMDAANVDLKGFTEDFYRHYCGASLQPVLDTLEHIAKEGRTWLELTTLLIPGANDSEEDIDRMSRWILDHLGADVPLHFSAFHPDYRLLDKPPTPLSTLRRAREIALAKGLRYVYTGNLRDREGGTTFCPGCRKAIIERDGFCVLSLQLQEGQCECGATIAGVFGTDK